MRGGRVHPLAAASLHLSLLLALFGSLPQAARGTSDTYSGVTMATATALDGRSLRVKFEYRFYGRDQVLTRRKVMSSTKVASDAFPQTYNFVAPNGVQPIPRVDQFSVLQFVVEDQTNGGNICKVELPAMVTNATPGSSQTFTVKGSDIAGITSACPMILSLAFSLTRAVPTDPSSICDGCQPCPTSSLGTHNCNQCISPNTMPVPSFGIDANFGCPASEYPACVGFGIQCSVCPPGSFCTGDGFATPCTNLTCSQGMHATPCNATADSTCAPCPPNQQCPGGSSPPIMCVRGGCPAGQAMSDACSSACAPCQAGMYCPAGSGGPQPCSPLSCSPGMQLTECRVADNACSATGCGSGATFCPGLQTAAQQCSVGITCTQGFEFVPCSAAQDATCRGCPSGSFCSGGQALAMACSNQSCAIGTAFAACTSTTDSSCTTCPQNSFCAGNNLGATPCSTPSCPVGMAFSACTSTTDATCGGCDASSFCLGGTSPSEPCTTGPCPAGFFRSVCTASADATCMPCPAGLFCLAGSVGPQPCSNCAAQNLDQISPCTATANAICLDATPPTLTLLNCPGLTTVSCEWQAGAPFVFRGDGSGFIVSDNSNPSPTVTVTGTVDANTLGVQIVTYVASDGSPNSTDVELTRTVEVVDTTPPAIVFLPSDNAVVEAGDPFDAASPTSVMYTDNLDSPATLRGRATIAGLPALAAALSTPTPGVFNVTYAVADTNSNRASRERRVEVRDTTAPVIIRQGPTTVDVPLTNMPVPFNDTNGVVVSDAVDKDIRPTLIFQRPFDSSVAGIYTFFYTANDSAGNPAIPAQRTLVVADRTAPVLSYTPQDTVLEADATNSTYQPFEALTATDDVDGPLPISITVTEQSSGARRTGSAAFSSFVDKTRDGDRYLVEYEAVDAAGNPAVASYILRIVDSLPPVLRLVGPAASSLTTGEVFDDPGVVAMDGLDGPVPAVADPPGPYPTDTGFTINYTATDRAGNAASVQRSVTFAVAAGGGGGGGGGGGALVFAAVGAGIGLLLLVLLVVLLLRRRRNRSNKAIAPRVVGEMPMSAIVPASADLEAGAVGYLPTNVQSVPWFHGHIPSAGAEELLSTAPPGSFLVRSKTRSLSGLVLSVAGPDTVHNYRVAINESNEYTVRSRPCADYGSNLKSIIDHFKINKGHLCTELTHPVPRPTDTILAEAQGGRHYVRFLRKPRALNPRVGLFAKCATDTGSFVFAQLDRKTTLPTIPLYYPVHFYDAQPQHNPYASVRAARGPVFARVASTEFEAYVQLADEADPPRQLLLFRKLIGDGVTFVPLPNEGPASSLYASVGDGARAEGVAPGSFGDEPIDPSVLSLYQTVNKPRTDAEAEAGVVADPGASSNLYATVSKPAGRAAAHGDEVPSDPSVLALYKTVRKGKGKAPLALDGASTYEAMDDCELYDTVDAGAGSTLYEAVAPVPKRNPDGLVYASLDLAKTAAPAPPTRSDSTIYAHIQTPVKETPA